MSMKWDRYFLSLCDAVAANSECHSRQIGAVVATKDHTILSTGYNGPPRGYPHCEAVTLPNGDITCKRRTLYPSGQGLHLCPAAHAEANAIFAAARQGQSLKGATIYMNCPVPCKDCLIAIIQTGIDEIVCRGTKNYYDYLSGSLISELGLNIREFDLGQDA